MNHPKYRPDIDGLRAIAVLSVLGYHAFPTQFKAGFIGVDIFFVISGYLISSIIFDSLDRNNFSFLEFYGRRVKRIFPALILVLLCSFIFAWFALFADELQQLGKHMAAGAAFVSNFAFWQESGYFDNSAETKPLLHLWSLAIEEQFYIFWPLIAWLLWEKKWIFIAALLSMFLISYGISAYLVRADMAAAFYSPISRVWELLAGTALAYLAFRKNLALSTHKQTFTLTAVHKNALAFFGALLLAIAFYRINSARPFPGSWALLPVLGAFFLIAAGPESWINRYVLSNRLLVSIGLISYPLYLWHWPILTFARIVESDAPSAVYQTLALLLSGLLAWLTYRFVERPIRSGKRTEKQNKLLIASLCLAMLLVGGTGVAAYFKDGFTTRFAAQASGMNVWNNFSFRKSCAFLTKQEGGDDWCNIGNAPDKAPSVVLLGDSVGNGYAPMLNAFANAHPGRGADQFIFRQFAKGACPMLLDIGPENCREVTQSAKAYIEQNASIHTVILAPNWSAYFHGTDWYGKHAFNHEQFKAALTESIRHYQRFGKRVLVFLAPPIGANPRACVVRPVRITTDNKCTLDIQDVKNNDVGHREPLKALLNSLKVDYFDPYPYMCGTDTCKVTDGPRIMYLDHAHFSKFGGEYLAARADGELAKLFSAKK